VTAYAAVAPFPANMLLIAGLFSVLGVASAVTWMLFGTALRRLVSDPGAVRVFNLVMAGLLVLSLIPVLLEA
jgi:threonine/homoserine/homoserine lactone efflux protein